jgi:hypothetical protein
MAAGNHAEVNYSGQAKVAWSASYHFGLETGICKSLTAATKKLSVSLWIEKLKLEIEIKWKIGIEGGN